MKRKTENRKFKKSEETLWPRRLREETYLVIYFIWFCPKSADNNVHGVAKTTTKAEKHEERVRESNGTYGRKFKRNATNYSEVMVQGCTSSNNKITNSKYRMQVARQPKVVVVAWPYAGVHRTTSIHAYKFAEFMINVSNISTICNHKWKLHSNKLSPSLLQQQKGRAFFAFRHRNCNSNRRAPLQIATDWLTDNLLCSCANARRPPTKELGIFWDRNGEKAEWNSFHHNNNNAHVSMYTRIYVCNVQHVRKSY